MPRKYTIKYDDGKVINIGKWLDNMKSAERSKHLDKKWLEQLENIGLFGSGSKTDDASNGAVGPSTGNGHTHCILSPRYGAIDCAQHIRHTNIEPPLDHG